MHPRDEEDVALFAETVKNFRSVMHPRQSLTVSDDTILRIWMAHSDRKFAQWLISDDLTAEYVRGLIDGWRAAEWKDAP
jgi:hypothetical protein